jgi:hypothetical protein
LPVPERRDYQHGLHRFTCRQNLHVNDVAEETIDVASRRHQFSVGLILLRRQCEGDVETTRRQS